MLLYSTTLRINDTLTRDGFIQLVIQWNQSSPHEIMLSLISTGMVNTIFVSEMNLCGLI